MARYRYSFGNDDDRYTSAAARMDEAYYPGRRPSFRGRLRSTPGAALSPLDSRPAYLPSANPRTGFTDADAWDRFFHKRAYARTPQSNSDQAAAEAAYGVTPGTGKTPPAAPAPTPPVPKPGGFSFGAGFVAAPDPNAGKTNNTTEVPPPGSFSKPAPTGAQEMADTQARPYSAAPQISADTLYKKAISSHELYLRGFGPQAARFGPYSTMANKYGYGYSRPARDVDEEDYAY